MNTTLILLAVLITPVVWSLLVWRFIARFWPAEAPHSPTTVVHNSSENSLPDYQI